MMTNFTGRTDRIARPMRALACWMALGLMAAQSGVAAAQVRTVDPNTSIDADLAPVPGNGDVTPPAATPTAPSTTAPSSEANGTTYPSAAADPAGPPPVPTAGYQKDDVIAGAEGVFGKGAEGLGSMIEKILKDQGEPIGYIAGREASGAIIVGLRYGSGTLNHKIEGERKVYWTGPSVGFDVGGNASKVFVLVYNLFDTQKLFGRFPGAEGAAYVIGGFTATYLRKGDVVLIPIRLGVGWRLGVNAGYMKFSEKGRIMPF